MEHSPSDPPPDAASTPPGTPISDPLLPSDVPDPPVSARSDAFWAFLCAVGYLLLFLVSPRLPTFFAGLARFGLLGVALLLMIGFTVRAARAMRTGTTLVLNLLGALLLVGPVLAVSILLPLNPRWPGWPGLLGSPVMTAYAKFIFFPGLREVLLAWLAIGVGVGVSRLVREFSLLLPVAVVLALVDLYAVFGGGLVQQAQSGKSRPASVAMQALTVQLPQAPRPTVGGVPPPQLAVGFADFLFIALFFACFVRFGVPWRRTFQVMCVVLIAYLFAVAIWGIALPALVPIAIVVLGMHFRRFRYQPSELQALLIAGVLVVLILGAMVFFARSGR